jgi:outer membrane protein OmpA-like peptidoglycan-associated protein
MAMAAVPVKANDLNTGGQVGVVRTLSASTLGLTGLHIGGGFKYATGADYVTGPNGTASVVETATGRSVTGDAPQLLSGDVFLAYGLFSFIDISAVLPVYSDITGWGATGNGFGDIEVAMKMIYPGQREDAWMSHAYYFNVIFPTGDKTVGFFPRHAYYVKSAPGNTGIDAYSIDAVFFNPMFIWTFDLSKLNRSVPISFHANFGGVVAKAKSGSAVVAALALELKPARFITLFTELSGESRVKYYTESFDYASFDNDPFRLTPGMRLNIPGGFYFLGAGDIGFSDDRLAYRSNWNQNGYRYSTKAIPKWAGQVIFGWNGSFVKTDRDKDGIKDDQDKCPLEAEDSDGFQDADGCPDPDNDGDGVLDIRDSCPDKPARCSGCPVVDRDKDGLNDDRDACPAEPEDFDGYEDGDGCPDRDNDQDGILDQSDKCPTLAEDLDGFEDDNGCPDSDNDGDGIFDVADKCPDVEGDFEHNGCPAPKQTEPMARGSLVLSGVHFETGRAILSTRSYSVLDRVALSLKEWPDVRVEIQGHTDSRGDAQLNQRLSQARAETVRLYLIQHGVAPDRLTAIGYGEERPIETNNTADGRQKNRRVELHRVD